jgi:hypothetical protein
MSRMVARRLIPGATADVLHGATEIEPHLRVLAAVVRVALTDAQGGDAEAADWLAGPVCRAYCSAFLTDQPEVTAETIQAAILSRLPAWMRSSGINRLSMEGPVNAA